MKIQNREFIIGFLPAFIFIDILKVGKHVHAHKAGLYTCALLNENHLNKLPKKNTIYSTF